MSSAIVVIPCYNEARRLRLPAFAEFLAAQPEISFQFVDDGSTDATAELIDGWSATQDRAMLLRLPHNQGKAEAVRQGLLAALARRPAYVGFWDADLATPLSAIPEFVAVLDHTANVHWVFGSRVRLLGRHIERLRARHYLGRVWATAVSLLLGLPIYDTQCGAKLFRATPELTQLLAEPFITRWVFDVELIARLARERRHSPGPPLESAIYELPLAEWRDVAGSKLKARDFWRGGVDLLRIRHHYLRD